MIDIRYGTRGVRAGKVRTALITLLVVFLLLVAFVAMSPTLVSMGLGQGLVRNAMQKQVDGEVSFAALSLSWFGDQSVRGLQVVDKSGRQAVNVDLDADRGLVHLVRGAIAPLELTISGQLDGTIEADGSLSFSRLLRREDPDGSRAKVAKPKDRAPREPATLPDQGPIEVVLSDTTLQLQDVRSGRRMSFDDVNGRLTYDPGKTTRLQIGSTTDSSGVAGSVNVQAETLGLVDARGRMTPGGAGLQVNAELKSIPVLYAEVDSVIESMVVNVTSDDLTKQLLVLLEGEARVGAETPSHLEGRVVIDQPFNVAGEPTIEIERISGTLSGNAVPSGMLTPLLAAAGLGATIDPLRDLGPTLDLQAIVTRDDGGAMSATIDAERLEARLTGRISPGDGVVLGESQVRATVHPGLLAAATDLQADRPMIVNVSIERASIPGSGADGRRSLADLMATGSVRVEGPSTVGMSGEPTMGTLERLQIDIATDRLAGGLRLSGSGLLAGAELTIDEVVSGLVDSQGQLSTTRLRPVGRVAITGLPADLIDRRLVQDESARGYLAAAGATKVDVDLTTSERGSDLAAALLATLHAAAGETRLEVAARETAEGIAVDAATLSGVLTPGLLSRLQPDEPEPIEVAQATPFNLTVDPFVVPGGRSDGYQRPAGAVRARLRCNEALLERLPAMATSLGISNLDGTLSMLPAGASGVTAWGVLAKATLTSGANQLGAIDADLVAPGAGDAPLTGRLTIVDATVRGWERQLGYEGDTLKKWLGNELSVEIGLEEQQRGYQATVRPRSRTLDGTFVASVTDETVDLRSQDAAFTVRKRDLNELLSGQPAADAAAPDDDDGASVGATVGVSKALRLALAIDECRLPMGLLRGERVDPDAARVSMHLTGGPLELSYPDGTKAALRDIDLTVSTVNLRDGLRLRLDAASAVGERASAEAGTVAITGRLSNVLDDAGVLALAGSVLELDANLDALPTAIVDAMANFDGLLVDAVGPRADVRIVARDFSRDSGTLDATITATSGSLRASVAGVAGTLRSIEGKPNTGQLELTPEFRQRLLTRIHPIFADVRTVESPVNVSASNFVLPLDGETSRLSADLAVTVGAVELDSGSVLLGLIKVFDQNPKSTIAGYIEPIRATIRDGVVRYDRFAVKLDKFTLAYTGQIDLNSGGVDLRTEIPLSGLAVSFKELEGYADKITVPLVTRGTLEQLDQLKLEIDPQFDLAKQAAAAGFQGVLDELGRKIGDDLLRNILRGGRKKETDPP